MFQDFFMDKKRSKIHLIFLITLLVIFTFSSQMPVKEGTVLAWEKVEDDNFEAKELDKRAQIIQAYLARYNSPLRYSAQNFVDAADEYDLDWKLVVSIAGVESTFGKFIPGGYNAWGWGVYGTQAIYFKSWKDGIFTVSAGLRKNYLNRGLNNPYAINKVYAASPTWGSKVSYFLNDLEKFKEQYEIETQRKIDNNLAFNSKETSASLNQN